MNILTKSEKGHVTLSSIHSLLTQMNYKLSNIELKNDALDCRLTTKMGSLGEIQGTLNSMKWHFNTLEVKGTTKKISKTWKLTSKPWETFLIQLRKKQDLI